MISPPNVDSTHALPILLFWGIKTSPDEPLEKATRMGVILLPTFFYRGLTTYSSRRIWEALYIFDPEWHT